MKPTLMNVHICSMDKVNKSLMFSVFLAYKLRHGFIQCSKEEAEQTYQLDYEKSDVCSWLSLSGSHWHDDLFEGGSEHLGLAQDMGMGAVYFNVNPDGSAFFELADPLNHSAGLLTTGDAVPERYPDVNPFSKTNKSIEYGEEFMDTLASQAEFEDAMKVKYSSAEETASALSSLLHIRCDKLLIDAKYGNPTADTVTMHFKAAPADNKKLTIKAAFKKIYGDALKPLGFVWAKTKEPCFIRVIDNELIHIIGMKDMKNFIVMFAGVASLYRAELGLDHTYRDMSYWLPHAPLFYWKTRTDADEAADPRLGAKFWYSLKNPESVRYSMKSSLDATLRWVLPVLDQVKCLSDIPVYHERIFVPLEFCAFPFPTRGCSDAPIQYLLPNLAERFEESAARIYAHLEETAAKLANTDNADYIKFQNKRRCQDLEKERHSINTFLEESDIRQQVLDELERRKQANLEKLHSYGVI